MNMPVCSSCQNKLINPITLSCGYSVCKGCLPEATDENFVCPVEECEQERHLFGPSTHQDKLLNQILQGDSTMACYAGNHILQNPVTNHCGHTFCKTCLLERRMLYTTCPACQLRLPSYQFIQQQPITQVTQSLLPDTLPTQSLLSTTTNIPVHNIDFCILPTQRLRLPIPLTISKVLVKDPHTQALYIPVIRQPSNVGTIVKIVSSESGYIEVVGLERFMITPDGLSLFSSDDTHVNIRMATRIHDILEGLAHSLPSNSFCNAATGLLGPVWLNSVQDIHGPLPKDPVSLCWWTAIVLPVGNSERIELLNTASLNERLSLLLVWIQELQVQSDQSTPVNSVQVG